MLLPAILLLLAGNDDVALPTLVPGHASASLIVSVSGLRSTKGLVRICLTREPRFFPSCEKDPAGISASVPANSSAHIRIPGITSGDYALSVLHDENANGRVDMLLGIPREGVGFSRNPRLRFSAPSFAAVRFHIGAADVTQEVKMRYFL